MLKSTLGFLLLTMQLAAAAQGQLLSLNHDASGLGLASTNLTTQDYEMVGANGTTSDGYPSGVADLDCFGERFFYTLHPNKLVTLDAVTGEILHYVTVDNPLGADVPLTNIAYDWTDDKLYGIAHWYSNGTNIQLISVDPETGEVELVAAEQDYGASYGSGNCDIDALGNRYFMIGGDKLKVWDTTTGEMITNTYIPTLFGGFNDEDWTHLMYHPVEDRIYALHMRYPESNGNGGLYQTEIRLARIHPETAEVEWYTEDEISMDGIQSGLCDLDPFNNRIFYHRVNSMKMFTTEGESLGSISNPSGSISPWANVQYHDLSTDPTAIVGTDASVTSIEWDGESALIVPHGLGGAVAFEGWTGTDGETVMDEAWTVNGFGTVHVSGRRTGDNGRAVQVQRTYDIVPEPVVNGIGALTPKECVMPTAIRSSQALPDLLANATWYAITGASVQQLRTEAPASAGHYIVSREGCPTARITVY
ncbi:MAG: hypothetical protein O2818_00635 [Bacteroidetes bacterium]|nr:hypothetical protein [Bacteroidota bacterium]MDA1335368.1 hypothetical protein [Bacteroidota bacterium]